MTAISTVSLLDYVKQLGNQKMPLRKIAEHVLNLTVESSFHKPDNSVEKVDE